ncbi:MAG: DUF4998 domain-containing protein [Bacteroidales bacterium]|nr:DUF4998 domain-containing protein [Bacteroidales bacterium]
MNKLLYIIIIVILTFSCKDQDDIYKEYRVPNSTVYPGKPISPGFRSGDGYAEISWLRGSDPSVSYARIYWNNYTDSVQVEIPENADTVRHRIMLDEGNYAFSIKAFNSKDLASVPAEMIGKVYGDNFRATLFNRSAKNILYDPDTEVLTIEWVGQAENEVKCILKYVDIQDQAVQQSITLSEPTTVIENFKRGLSINSFFVPPSCIDTFASEPSIPKITMPALYKEVSTSLDLAGTKKDVAVTDHGTYIELVKTGNDPYIHTQGLTEALNLAVYYKVYFYIEYQNSREINDAQLFFGKPNAAGGVSTNEELHFDFTGLDAADESKWAVFKFDCEAAINTHGWGSVGHRFRYDFVATGAPDATVYIKKMWFEIYTLQEVDL